MEHATARVIWVASDLSSLLGVPLWDRFGELAQGLLEAYDTWPKGFDRCATLTKERI
jgi:hypothetical protein